MICVDVRPGTNTFKSIRIRIQIFFISMNTNMNMNTLVSKVFEYEYFLKSIRIHLRYIYEYILTKPPFMQSFLINLNKFTFLNKIYKHESTIQ